MYTKDWPGRKILTTDIFTKCKSLGTLRQECINMYAKRSKRGSESAVFNLGQRHRAWVLQQSIHNSLGVSDYTYDDFKLQLETSPWMIVARNIGGKLQLFFRLSHIFGICAQEKVR